MCFMTEQTYKIREGNIILPRIKRMFKNLIKKMMDEAALNKIQMTEVRKDAQVFFIKVNNY